MLDESVPIVAIKELQQNIAAADTLNQLFDVALDFCQKQLAAEEVELRQTAVSPIDPHAVDLQVPVNETGYSLCLYRKQPFDENERLTAEMGAALLAAAPFFRSMARPSATQLKLLQKVSQTVAVEQQFKAITTVLGRGFAETLPQANGKLYLWKEETGELVVHSILGPTVKTGPLIPIQVDDVMMRVIESGETAVLNHQSPPQLIVPATIKDKVAALLHVTYPYDARIPPGDVTFLELLVGYLGIALNNTRLLGQAWQRTNQLETIYRVTESTLALQSLESTLTAIQERLMSAFNASTCYVALYESDAQTITFPWIIRHRERISQGPISILDDNSLVAWVIANNQPFITNDSAAETTPVSGIPLGEALPQSIIIVPLRDGPNVLGAISIQNDAPNAFDSSEYKTFMTVASHIATIIKNARLYDQTKNLVNQGTKDYQTAVALRQAIAIISTSLEPLSVFNQLLIALSSVFTYDTAYAFTIRDDQRLQYITSRDFHNRPLPVTGNDLQKAWHDSPLINQIIEAKEAVTIGHTAVTPEWVSVSGNEAMQSWMGVPLVAQRTVVGLLMVHSQTLHAFDDREKWLATTLCAHTAVALNNARLYQRTQQQLSEISTLYQASATMTANLDQDFVLQTVVTEMVRALKVDSCTIFVWNEHKQTYDAAAHKSMLYAQPGEAQESVGLMSVEHLEKHPTLQRLFKKKEIYKLRQGHIQSEDDLDLLTASGMKSLLLVPLVRRQKMLGVIAMGQKAQPRSFRQSELWLAQNLAGQAAVAIEHAHLFSQAQRRIEELSTFHSIVLQLNTPLQLNSVLDTITDSALKLLPDASNLHIYLYDEETEEYTFGSALWRDGRRQAAVTKIRKTGLTATVVQSGKSVVINNASTHPLFQSQDASKWGISAIAGFPLKYGEQVIGAFTITYLHAHTFSQDELLLLNLLADQAAVAVKNARLFDDSQRRLRDMSALVDMAKQVTGDLKLTSVLQTTVQILQGLLSARASTITMLSDDETELVVEAAVGVSPEIMQEARMKVGEGVSGEALRRQETIYIQDTHKEPNFLFFSDVVRSLLVVPLVVRDKAIGTLSVDSDRPNAFSASDMQLMMIAAAQVGVAISNAGLFEEVEERAVELAVAYEELKESDRLKDELVQNLSHELRTPLTFVKGYVDLLQEGEMGIINEAQIEALNIVSSKTDEITHLIEDIITLQRIDEGNLQLEVISLADFLKTAVASHQIVAKQKGLNIIYKKPAYTAKVNMDKNRISQVVDNLIGNAMKFSPDGGTISVAIHEQTDDILVTIKDEGIGVPKEKQEKIFERFYQVDGSARRRFGGTGIGLAIVKRIIDAHKGQIWVESEVGEGSIFSFTLPKAVEELNVPKTVMDHV